MRSYLLSLSFITILTISSVCAQKDELTFNFFGQDAATSEAVALEKVMVRNVTQDCDTTVYGPDPQLTLEYTNGVDELRAKAFFVSTVYPNPFSRAATLDLQLAEPQIMTIRLINLQGMVVSNYSALFKSGTHAIKFHIPIAGMYYAEISNLKTFRTLKLVCKTSSSASPFTIHCEEMNAKALNMKQGLEINAFVFKPGDELQLIASAESYPDEIILDAPTSGQDFTFAMRPVPIANFMVEDESGVFPFTTSFIDMSERNPTSWEWNFGDGWLSTLQNNVHTFETSGYYTITLVAGNAYGTDTLIMVDFIHVKDIELVCDTTSGYAPLVVNFYGLCNVPDITSWTWDFGDGQSSNEQNPTHTYMEPGSYNNVTLTVTSGGNVYTDEVIIHVFNDLAEVNFTADITDGWVPQTIHFTSYTNISNPTGYQWSFGDGTGSYDVNPVHTYDNIGTYTVVLSVYNSNGVKTESKEDYITIRYCPGSVQDAEGNIYGAVGIGTNCWMSENLNMGTRINAALGAQTDNGVVEKFCYDNQEANCDTYGGLYQWDELLQYETGEGTQGLCPDDWHVATKTEFADMIGFLGGSEVAANKLKSTTGWYGFGGNGTNESGFNALPGGRFWGFEDFDHIYEVAHFWLTHNDSEWSAYIHYTDDLGYISAGQVIGFSARCVKDNTMKK
ncbi:MAG: PKD domain-containing protein [Bacteroidetes bacterium]|nr:PKD domain-containing protein [Bacteroidota bacterium]